jgi:hypothetical protein
MRSHLSLLITVAVATLLVPITAQADRRSFTRTYEYTTMPEGQTELEIYSTQTRNRFTEASARSFELQLEVEYGVTDRFDLGLYQVFEQSSSATESEPLHFSEIKLRGRYRFAERGELPLDLLAYFEGAKEFGEGVYEAEAKLIAARDFDRLLLSTNLIGEVVFGPDATSEVELGWAVGAAVEVTPQFRIGAESYGMFEVEEPEELSAYVGPALSWAPPGKLWVAGTAGFGITDEADRIAARFILGIDL